MEEELKHVAIYTDGACDPNPGGPGGYGVVLIFNGIQKRLSGGFRSTTSNRMEIFAALKGLESLKTPCQVTLYSDSKYLVNAIMKRWAKRWQENDWWRTETEKAINVDLWERLLALCEIHQVEFKWVKGHVGNYFNEECDALSTAASRQKNLHPDDGYENRTEDDSRKITVEGQPCRKCSTPVIKRKPRKAPKRGQAYYFEYYLYCPKCEINYLVEDAKRFVNKESVFGAWFDL